MLHSDQFWVWDSWYAQDGEETHVFFLKAPRSLGDPDLRHDRAVIGHAVSRDLTELSLIHISEPTRLVHSSRMPSSA